jgi:ubiquitin carboxyl-terminal hydrolase 7
VSSFPVNPGKQLAENDMLVDDYDYPTEKTDVVVVSPSGSESEAVTADDRTFFVVL